MKTVKLSPKSIARIEEMREHRAGYLRKPVEFDTLVEWLILRQYNRARAVRRHALAIRGHVLEISPLEQRGLTDDE